MDKKQRPDTHDCLRCPEDKICCLLTLEEFEEYHSLDAEAQSLIARLVSSGTAYATAKKKVLAVKK